MSVSPEAARHAGDVLRVDWGVVSPDTFRRALEVELEHRDVTRGDLELTGRIALGHLREFPDYYDRLAPMEEAASEYWAHRPKPSPTLGGSLAAHALACSAALVSILALVLIALAWAGRAALSYPPRRGIPLNSAARSGRVAAPYPLCDSDRREFVGHPGRQDRRQDYDDDQGDK